MKKSAQKKIEKIKADKKQPSKGQSKKSVMIGQNPAKKKATIKLPSYPQTGAVMTPKYDPETLCQNPACKHPFKRHTQSRAVQGHVCLVHGCKCYDFQAPDQGLVITGTKTEGGLQITTTTVEKSLPVVKEERTVFAENVQDGDGQEGGEEDTDREAKIKEFIKEASTIEDPEKMTKKDAEAGYLNWIGEAKDAYKAMNTASKTFTTSLANVLVCLDRLGYSRNDAFARIREDMKGTRGFSESNLYRLLPAGFKRKWTHRDSPSDEKPADESKEDKKGDEEPVKLVDSKQVKKLQEELDKQKKQTEKVEKEKKEALDLLDQSEKEKEEIAIAKVKDVIKVVGPAKVRKMIDSVPVSGDVAKAKDEEKSNKPVELGITPTLEELQYDISNKKVMIENQERMIDQQAITIGVLTKDKQTLVAEVEKLKRLAEEKNGLLGVIRNELDSIKRERDNNVREAENRVRQEFNVRETPEFIKLQEQYDNKRIEAEEFARQLQDVVSQKGEHIVELRSIKTPAGPGLHAALVKEIANANGKPVKIRVVDNIAREVVK